MTPGKAAGVKPSRTRTPAASMCPETCVEVPALMLKTPFRLV